MGRPRLVKWALTGPFVVTLHSSLGRVLPVTITLVLSLAITWVVCSPAVTLLAFSVEFVLLVSVTILGATLLISGTSVVLGRARGPVAHRLLTLSSSISRLVP